jgi:AraC-like DNA-binding protein
MRTPLATMFHETADYCFGIALETILGRAVRDSVIEIAERAGISRTEISSRFDETVGLMLQVFGPSVRVIVHKMLVELYREYSQRIDFSYEDSLEDQLVILRERVVTDHLYPKRLQTEDSFFDSGKAGALVETSEPGNKNRSGWNSFYSLKKGVGSGSH